MKHLKLFKEYVNESIDPFRLPSDANLVWNKVLEILPELKKSKWIPAEITRFKRTFGDHLWNLIPVIIHDKRELWARFYPGGDYIGFRIFDENNNNVHSSGGSVNTMDPIEIALIINKEATEDWIVNNREKGWVKITGKKYGI